MAQAGRQSYNHVSTANSYVLMSPLDSFRYLVKNTDPTLTDVRHYHLFMRLWDETPGLNTPLRRLRRRRLHQYQSGRMSRPYRHGSKPRCFPSRNINRSSFRTLSSYIKQVDP